MVLHQFEPQVHDDHLLIVFNQLLCYFEKLREELKALVVDQIVENKRRVVFRIERGPSHYHSASALLTHKVGNGVEDSDENYVGGINLEIVLRLKLDDLIEEVPYETINGEVFFEIVFLIELVFILDHALDDPVEVLVVIPYQLLQIRSLGDQGLNFLPARLIIEH